MVVADSLDVSGPVVGQAEEGTDVLGPLGKLSEQGAAFGLAGGLGGRLLLALASTEHGTSWRGSSAAHAAIDRSLARVSWASSGASRRSADGTKAPLLTGRHSR